MGVSGAVEEGGGAGRGVGGFEGGVWVEEYGVGSDGVDGWDGVNSNGEQKEI